MPAVAATMQGQMTAMESVMSSQTSRKASSRRSSGKGSEEENDELPLGIYLSWVKTELDNESACLELPFTLILLLSFSVLAYLHLRQADVFVLEGAIRFDIEQNANFAWSGNFGHKTIFDVNSIADFYSWLRIGFLPLMVQHSWGYSESLQDGYNLVNASSPFDSSQLPGQRVMSEIGGNALPIRDDYLHYNRIIGGFRLRQERVKSDWDMCRMPSNIPPEVWKPWLGKPCARASPSYELTPQIAEAEQFAGPPGRVEWLLSAKDSVKKMQMKSVDMEDGCSHLADKISNNPGDGLGGDGTCLCTTCVEGDGRSVPWIDEQTQRTEIAFVVFNWEYGLYSLVSVNFFFNRAGRIHKLVDIRSAWASSFPGSLWEVVLMGSCDLIWLFSLTYILICEVKEVVKVVRSSKSQWYTSLWENYMEFWNTVDWISILVAYFLVVCWFRTFLATQEVNSDFEQLARIDTTTVSHDDYTSAVEGFVEQVEVMCEAERIYRVSFMFYPMVVMLRLFKSFDAQPRLAVVTQTLVTATQDMIHFFIIFFSCYFCMVVNAVLLFGQDAENFSTLGRATMACFRTLFGGWDYDEMEKVGLLQCAIWFWAFIMILLLLLLNILLAILMDAYAEVQSSAQNKLSLPNQISEMVRRYRQTQLKQRVRLNDIWAAFFKAVGDEKDMLVAEPGPGFAPDKGGREMVTPQEVINRVHKYMRVSVPMSQAKRGLVQARNAFESKDFVPYTMVDVHRQLSLLQSLTRGVRDQIQGVAMTMRRFDFDENDEEFMQQVPEDPEQDCTEHRMLVAHAVRNVVSSLADEIGGTLTREAEMFSKRQKALEEAQAEMLVTARDASTTLERLRGRTDEIVRELQTQATRRQRRVAGQTSSAVSIAASVLAGLSNSTCGAPGRPGG